MFRSLFVGVLVLLAASPTAGRPSARFRDEHGRIQGRLNQIAQKSGSISTLGPEDQRRRMTEIVQFFREEIEPHAQWEERVLYPAVDRRMKSVRPFTSTMRGDHRVVERWVQELDRMARSEKVDPVRFGRAVDRLLGLLAAHFENEEQVLLPVLDEGMSPEEFDREIMSKAHH